MSDRCSHRKHVIENGQPWCDCKELIIAPTAAGNAQVVTLIRSVKADWIAILNETRAERKAYELEWLTLPLATPRPKPKPDDRNAS